MSAPHLMLFDLYAGGHRLQYLQNVATYWAERNVPGRLSIVIPRTALKTYTSLVDFAQAHRTSGLAVEPLTRDVHLPEAGPFRLARLGLEQARHLRRAINRLRPDHAVLMYFDHAQLALALDLRFAFPVRLSGIYFRPSFHYSRFSEHTAPTEEHLRNLRKRVLLWSALRNPHFGTLFCLDPYVMPDVRRMGGRPVALPDGVVPRMDEAADVRWGIEAGRKTVLLFGSLARRKGIFEVLDAMRRLPETDQRQLALVLGGPVVDPERAQVLREVRALKYHTPLQVIFDERFIPDEEIQPMVRRADLVLLTYQHHIGSSNVLARAAMAGVPVLATDYGLIGKLVRERRLGQTIDATSAADIAAALSTFLEAPSDLPFSLEDAARFAEGHTAEAFARTILAHTVLQRTAV